MDFFHSLIAGRNGVFKTSMMNGWAMVAFKPPTTDQENCHVAGYWVKPTSRLDGGTSATYVTIKEGTVKQRCKDNYENKKPMAKSEGEQTKKTPEERPQFKYFNCKEKEHFTNKCPKKMAIEVEDGFANATWQEEQEAGIFMTVVSEHKEYVVNNTVNITQRLLQTDVLLDNHANISIVNLVLLDNV
jgi:hypothetical protein